MILRSLTPPPPSLHAEPVWIAVERSQRQDFSSGCWMIPQPAHAALAGDIAAQLDPKVFPGLTPEVVRAIALHDAGWSLDDAALIQQSRAQGARARPHSFIAAAPRDTAAAWTGSIEIAGKATPLGEVIVSRHFAAIAENYRTRADEATVRVLEGFLTQEAARQARLRKKVPATDGELEGILHALQFCDLLSLYLSCGLSGDVGFPQVIAGRPILLQRQGEDARFSPYPFVGACTFSVSGLRHPRGAEGNAATFTLSTAP